MVTNTERAKQQKESDIELFFSLCSRKEFKELRKFLKENEVDVNHTKDKKSAIHIAAEAGDLDTLRILIEYKADLNVKSDKKTVPDKEF